MKRTAACGPRPVRRGHRRALDRGAITSLLVPTPTAALAAELRTILVPHDALEEADGGVYDVCDTLLSGEAAALLARMATFPPVKVGRYQDGPAVHRTAAAALEASARQFDRRPPF